MFFDVMILCFYLLNKASAKKVNRYLFKKSKNVLDELDKVKIQMQINLIRLN